MKLPGTYFAYARIMADFGLTNSAIWMEAMLIDGRGGRGHFILDADQRHQRSTTAYRS